MTKKEDEISVGTMSGKNLTSISNIEFCSRFPEDNLDRQKP